MQTPRSASGDLADESHQDALVEEVGSHVDELIRDNAVLEKVRVFLGKCVVFNALILETYTSTINQRGS